MSSFRSKLANLAGVGSSNSNSGTANQQQSSDDVDFLLKTIDEQNEKIVRLQNKFRDVTHAYKSLLSEKKALEITLKTLKSTPSALLAANTTASLKSSTAQLKTTSSQLSSRSVSISDISEQEDQAVGQEKFKSIDNLENAEDKVAALTSNIQLLIENKSNMEQSYIAEKKKLRADLDEMKRKVDANKQENEHVVETYENRIKELKVSLKQSQTEREKLVQDLNAMVKSKSKEQENKILSMNEENQTILLNLRNENNDLKTKMKKLNRQFENKCEELVQCEKDYNQIKEFHEQQIKEDEKRLHELKEELNESNGSYQRRINDLETKLSEMCSTIAEYESKQNQSLSKKLNDPNYSPDLKTTKQALDLDSAIEQISELKTYVESTARDLNINFNFNEIWLQPKLNSQEQQQYEKDLQDQIEQLKNENRSIRDEFEKHKIRTNYLIKSVKQPNKESPDGVVSNQANDQRLAAKAKLKDEVELYKKRIVLMEKQNQDDLKNLKETHEEAMLNMKNECKTRLEKSENEKLKAIGDLENELVKQRERTVKLLSEKENELNQYREKTSLPRADAMLTTTTDTATTDSTTSVSLDDDAKKNDLASETRLIHYNQESAYKESELHKLRVAKSQLEYRIKQLCDEHSVDVDRFETQTKILKEEIERLKLNESRVVLNSSSLSANNLEYIKNVIFNFITTKDNNVRLAMINAITQILQFSKSEKQRIQSVSNKLR